MMKLPQFWKLKKVEDLGNIVSGGTPKTDTPQFWDGDINWVTPTDITALKGKRYIKKTNRCISDEGLKSSSARILPENSLVICTRATIGISAINLGPLCTNQGFKSIIPYSDILTEYLYYWFSLNQNLLIKLSSGSTFLELSTKAFKSIQIPIPPFSEQKKIAEILSTVDDKIEIIDQQIAETQELKKGLMQKLLTRGIGHTEFKDSPLGEIPKSWEVISIGQVLTLGNGKDYKHLDAGNIPVFGTGGVITHVSEHLYEGESVGIGRKGTIDKPVLLSGKFWTVDTLFYTHSFKGIIPYFVYLLFQSINWKSYNEATGVPSLSKTIIEPIKISLPPLNEQVQISDIFLTIDDKLKVLESKKVTYVDLKKGLMQKLLSGQIRVDTTEAISA